MASPQHTPDKVSQSFIKQYYQMLSTNPGDLYRFYNDKSSFTHSFGPQVEASVCGQTAIRAKVDTLNLEGAIVDLSNGSVDAQASIENAVFLTVTGTFARRGDVPRSFVQSFFLATQVMGQGALSYFVMNSVFRLLSDEAHVAEEHAPALEKARPQQVEADKGAGSVPQAVHKHEHAVAPAPAPAAEPAAPAQPEPAADPVTAPEPVAEQPAAVEEEQVEQPVVVEASAPAPAVAGPPKSFLDAAKKSLPEAAVAKPAPAPKPKARATAQPREDKGESKDSGAATHAIWINNVAERTTSEELAQIFGKFGNVRKVDVPAGRGFAFVDFESAAAVQAVLASGEEFTVNGKTLRVQAKSSSKSANGRKGGAAKGRASSPKNGEKRDRPKEGGARRGGEGKRSPDRKDRPAQRASAESKK